MPFTAQRTEEPAYREASLLPSPAADPALDRNHPEAPAVSRSLSYSDREKCFLTDWLVTLPAGTSKRASIASRSVDGSVGHGWSERTREEDKRQHSVSDSCFKGKRHKRESSSVEEETAADPEVPECVWMLDSKG